MLKTSKTARVFAGVVGFAMVVAAFGAFAAPVKAQTTDLAALQALVASLQAQIAALTGGSSSGSMMTGSAPMAPLTVGSSGAEVTKLQNFLISKGYGSFTATGYFGSMTQSALAAFQAANGVTPAAGYYGPVTAAKVASMMGGTTGGVTPPVTGPVTASGEEGELAEIDNNSTDVESTLSEDEEDVKVFGVEFEAQDSEMTVDRVDVYFALLDAENGSDDLEDYVTEVSLFHGDKKIASMDVDEADIEDAEASNTYFGSTADENDYYSFRFSGLKVMVDEDDTAELYVAVSAVGNIDTADANDDWAVTIPVDGIRATDGAGISETYVDSNDLTKEQFAIETADAGDLELQAKASDNEDRIITVDEDSDTNGEVVLTFTLESDSSDNWVDEIGFDLATTTSTTTSFSTVIKKLHLYADGEKIGSEDVDNGAAGGASALFENLDLTIDEDEEVEFTLEADFNDVEDNAWDGYQFNVVVDASDIDAEDMQGDDVTVSGDQTGGNLELRTSGISVSLVSANATNQDGGDAVADTFEGTIKFSVTNTGSEDIFIDGDVTNVLSPTTGTDGLSWATTSNSTATTTSGSSVVLSAEGSEGDDVNTSGAISYIVEEGDSRDFTLTFTIPAGAATASAVGTQITGIKWDLDSGDAHANLYTFNIDDLKTVTVTGLKID